jgi:succinoglycan biosynthesis transport protein ExoP
MPEHRTEPEHSNFNLNNILFAFFRWKRTILGLTVFGLIAAAAVYFFVPTAYESDARLLVRYVLERSGYDPVDSISGGGTKGGSGLTIDAVIAAEVSILTSWDLSVQVAEALGPSRVLPDSKSPSVLSAAAAINSGLSTTTSKGSNIIAVAYQNKKPEVATAVLNELVTRYFTKHLEVHRSAGAFDFVSAQADQIRARLNQTEDQLKKLKAQTGVMSFQDSVSSLNGQVTHLDDQLRAAQSDLAEQQAKVKQIEQTGSLLNLSEAEKSKDAAKDNTKESTKADAKDATPTLTPQGPSSKDVGDYQALMANLTHLRETQLEMSAKYTDQNPLVKMNQAHIAEMENQKRNLEKKYPELLSLQKGIGPMDLRGERVRLAGMKSKVDDMIRQKAELQERMKQLADLGPQVTNLERTKEMDEQNYKYYSGTLQKARVDEALDPSKMPNISAIQRPSPPGLVTKTRNKIALGIAGGGFALGLGLALLFELFLSRSYKRRSEIEHQLHSPVMLSIPYQTQGANGRRLLRLPWKNGQHAAREIPEKSKPNLAPWEVEHFIRPYSEAIRDRLGLYFELHGVTHKPKLIGVTGFSDGAGTSTLAAGVAAALSETGDGKVLLVDVNAANGEVHPFFAGRPAAALTTAIKPEAAITSAADNLYLATVNQSGSKSTHLGLKKFFALVPNLKASDFDYIIFDMPPINQTSPTIGLAALMDKVLLVVEAEKTSRDTVKRGYRELVGARADVAVVLNKTRSYGPNWLESGS